MKRSNEYVESIQKLNLRIDEIEKLIRLLLINNLVDDATGSFVQTDEIKIDSKVQESIQRHHMMFDGYESIGEIEVIGIAIPKNVSISIRDLKDVYSVVKETYPNVEPLFKYQTINGMQRKKIFQENMSFSVKGKEIHICHLEEKRK